MAGIIMEFMSKDHDRLDGIFKKFQEIKKGDGRRALKQFAEFKIGLQRHIVWEEEILFPLFEKQTGMKESGPTAVMRMEHREIKGYLEKIHDAVAEGNLETDEFERGLISVLTGHNDKEETVLYPWIDSSLSEKEKKEVLERMKKLPPEKYNKCCE